MKLGTWLLALLQPALARILSALGFSVVSIVGLDVGINALKAQALSGMSLLSPATLQLFLL